MRGAQLVVQDYVEKELTGERLDDGGGSSVSLRVANVLSYVVLKIFAFQDRHENKDAYDLIFTLLNFPDGPTAAGRLARSSLIANHPQVVEAISLLEQRFSGPDQDGPVAYGTFLADEPSQAARLRQDAVATVRVS